MQRKLNFLYIDSELQCIELLHYFDQSNFILKSGGLKNGFLEAMKKVKIDFSNPDQNGESFVRLNNSIVEKEIRNLNISKLVSEVSKNTYVRKEWLLFNSHTG